VLNPLPSDDDSLIGRVIGELPSGGRSLEEVARPNPCAEKLTETKRVPALATFEDAEELAVGGKATATLGTFGFSGDVSRATHFVYKVQTSERLSKLDTTEYELCCKEKNSCGYGFISALVYGSGEYATAEETAAAGGANVVFLKAEGSAALRILHRRQVKGYVAALIRVSDPSKAGALASTGSLGDPSAYGVKLDAATLPTQVKDRYDRQRAEVTGNEGDWAFTIGGKFATENSFASSYRAVTGSRELDDVPRRKNSGLLIGSGGALIASGVVFGLGIANLHRACGRDDSHDNGANYFPRYSPNDDCASTPATQPSSRVGCSGTTAEFCAVDSSRQTSNATGVGLVVVGGAAVAAFGAWFVYEFFTGDGRPNQHDLALPDAQLYTQKYNRTLLRNTVKETEQKMRLLQSRSLLPEVTIYPNPFGISGTF
jgi:hypothetical protein